MARRFKYPIRRSPKSDPQQYRVYRMENECIGARHLMRLSRTTIKGVIASVCRNYRIKRPAVVWTNLGRWAAQWCPNETIELNTKKSTASDLLTITHELAHHLHYCIDPELSNKQEAHGPEFMACHMSILDTLRIIPVVAMKVICDKYKIRYKDPGSTNSLKRLIACVK